MPNPGTELEATAYHEAGHAVASFLLARGIAKLSIVPDEEGESLGRLHHGRVIKALDQYDPSSRHRRWLESAIIISLAGPAAEERFTGTANEDGASSDHRQSVDAAFVYTGGDHEEAEAFLSWLEVRARRMIEAEWYLVEALAAALLERRELGGARVREVIRSAATGGYSSSAPTATVSSATTAASI